MPSLERGSNRIVIAGASSLLGAELRSLLEESRFAGAEFRLVDEEIAAGTLTEAGGEPAVIQPVEEGSFEKARISVFRGFADFTRANLEAAAHSGAKVIDLSGGIPGHAQGTVVGSRSWMRLRGKVSRRMPASYAQSLPRRQTAAASLALRLSQDRCMRLVVICLSAGVRSRGVARNRGTGEPDRAAVVVSRARRGSRVRHAGGFQLLDRFGPQQPSSI